MQYPIEICTETLATVLDDLGTEAVSRSDAVAWAQALLDAYGTAHPGCYSFGREHNDFCWTWEIVFNATTHELGYSKSGPPFFFRPQDFAEWAARTRCIDHPHTDAAIFPVRPHQCHRLFYDVPAFAIAAPFSDFRSRLGDTIRSVDGLSLLDEYMLGSQWGVRYLLQSHPGDRYSDTYAEGFSVTLPCGVECEAAIPPLIEKLGFSMDTVLRW